MDLTEKYQHRVQHRKNKRIKEVLRKAVDVFSEKGIEQTNMTDVAKTSNIGVATVYRYFNNKTTLVIEAGIQLWRDVNAKYEACVQEIIDDKKLAIDKLEELLFLYLKILKEEEAFIRFLDSFDNYIVNNSVKKEALKIYETEVLRIDPYIHKIYKLGEEDDSIKAMSNIHLFNRMVGHAIIALSQKSYIRHDIISSDEGYEALEEVELLIKMVLEYARK